MMAAGMAQRADAQAQLDCAGLVNRLYYALDEHDYTVVDQLFAEDAQFVRLGARLDGVAAIRAAFAKRPRDMATRHVISNAVVTLQSETAATGVFYMLVVRRHGVQADTPRPIPVPGPWRLSVVRAAFRRTADGWRIARQETESAFEFAGG